jgi:hypothetical protein
LLKARRNPHWLRQDPSSPAIGPQGLWGKIGIEAVERNTQNRGP